MDMGSHVKYLESRMIKNELNQKYVSSIKSSNSSNIIYQTILQQKARVSHQNPCIKQNFIIRNVMGELISDVRKIPR